MSIKKKEMGDGGGASEIFQVKSRLDLPHGEIIEIFCKHSEADVNFFAIVIKSSGDLILVCDHKWPFDGSQRGWTLKHVPWFDDPGKRISATTFDDEGILFLGTWDGTVYELRTRKVLGSVDIADTDLQEVCRLNNIRVLNMLVYNQESNKIVICYGENGKFVLLTSSNLPILVSFTSHIIGVDLFINKTGLTCALVCLESGQNVYTILDDLDLPSVHSDSHNSNKRSIFKKAKDNLMSRLSEDKLNFFGKKKDSSPQNSTQNISQNLVSSATTSTITSSPNTQHKQIPLTNVKFQTIDEVSCRGLITKIKRQTQFLRHTNNKLDLFDGDFRQTAAIFIPSSVAKLFVIQRLYFAVDEENECVRVAIINNAVFKEFAVVPFSPRILSIEPFGEEGTPYTVFIIAENGIYEMHLRKTPIETCVDLLLKETGNNLLDSVCSALNVPKTQVCVLAGDARSEEGKFSKTIIYYKLAGLTYAQICAKFGSRQQIPAMLFFFELVDQERTKLAGGSHDRQLMADLALLGRIEQYLRYAPTLRSELPRNPQILLKKMLVSNVYYSSAKAAQYLSIPELMWALKVIGDSRRCYPDILNSLYENQDKIVPQYFNKKIFWNLLTSDWIAIYTARPEVFFWFRSIVWKVLTTVNNKMLLRLLNLLLPWRRELQRKIFTEISDLTGIIDFTIAPEVDRVVIDDYVSLFLVLLLEAVRRGMKFELPSFMFKLDTRILQKKEICNHKNNMVATMMLSYTFVKSFSASGNHCVCVRNGKVFCWGENKQGRLGIGEDRGRVIVDTPTPILLSHTLKIYIESVCAGHSHNLALTNFGTILVWGSNKFGQLGIGRKTSYVSRPISLDIPNVIFTCIAAGSYHSVAIDHLNRVWTWGWGIYGQLGNGSIENVFKPTLVDVKQEKIVFVSAGHSHTAMLTCYGRVFICGCNHFGQLGLGSKESKVKSPELITGLPSGTIIRLIEAGVCSTVFVTTKNRLFYCGLNPASLKSLLSGAKRREKPPAGEVIVEEEKDFNEPTLIDTGHMAGDINLVSAASTHFGVMTSLGYVYTWGIGKSGQLVRPDDDSKTLELIDCDEKMIIASNICCAGDCTFVIERDTGLLYGCGFNSSSQLGRMESEEEQSVMTVRTKKRVVKIRQPSNIYFRLREIHGLPKQLAWEGDSSIMSSHKISPQTNIVSQELLDWCLNVFRRNYDAQFMTARCVQVGNFEAASHLETLAENHELALKHNLAAASGNKKETENSIDNYLETVGNKSPSVEQACRFLAIVINHWVKFTLPSCDLEEILDKYRNTSVWGSHLNHAIKEIITTADDSADWIASHLTPLFILSAIKETHSPVFKNVAVKGASANTDHFIVSDSDASSSDSPTTTKVNGLLKE